MNFQLPDDREAVCQDAIVPLPAGTTITGQLLLVPSYGPFNIKEYDHPHVINADLSFTLSGSGYRYHGLIDQWRLWAPNGSMVQLV